MVPFLPYPLILFLSSSFFRSFLLPFQIPLFHRRTSIVPRSSVLFPMPFGDAPDYVQMRTNESHMQLIAMDSTDTTASTPPPREEPPAVIFIPGKGTARWWRVRTGFEKVLISLSLMLLLLCIILIFVILTLDRRREFEMRSTEGPPSSSTISPSTTSSSSSSTEPPLPICTTPGCVRAANNLLNAMNQSVDPCENFYDFACGSWNTNNPIPDDMFAFGTFSHVREQVRLQSRVLLEQEVSSPSRSINMARIAYKTCMNISHLDELKTTLLVETIEELGGWPLLNSSSWTNDNFNLTEMLSRARSRYGADVFYQLYVYADAKNTTRNTLFVDQGGLTLGRGARDYYLNNTLFATHMNAYRKYLFNVVKLLQKDLNISRKDEELNEDINNVIAFETKLANITVAEDERRNNTRMHNRRTFSDLQQYLPDVNWVQFFQAVAPSDIRHLFHNETEVIVCEIDFLKKVSALLKETKPLVLVNYIIWRVVQTNVRFLDERFEDIKQDFVRVMTGQQQRSPRWKDCAQVPATILPLAAGAIYVDAHFNSEDKKEAVNMIKHLKTAFTELVLATDWMDDSTKAVAVEKAKSMINNIGYPELIKDQKKLDKEYEQLEIIPSDTYYSLMVKAVVWMQNKEFRKLLKPFDRHEFDVSPAIVNAFYSPERNAISFPAGILQPPFFSGSFPKAVNYGAMGAVIGHEITHGFDDQGSQYDKAGNLHNWWSEQSLKAFDERRQCIVDQYGKYIIPKTTYRVNGKLTQGENIADNGGVKEAFRAYESYVSNNGEEARLPGLQHFDNRQIFFLSYAHFWCGQKKEAAAMQQVLTDEHSPEVFRVLGVLSNMQQFADAFHCASNSPTNPLKKCVVW